MKHFISLVTICWNSEKTISRTIESVLRQNFCDYEYIIIDGASTDNTINIIKQYSPLFKGKLKYTSEPDKGIYDAMNKGIRLAEGDIIGLLNTDDTYEPDTIETVLKTFGETKCELMFANIRIHKQDGSSFIKKARLRRPETSRDWNHPTTFVRADIYKEYPFRNLGIHDDYGFFLQMKKQKRNIVVVDKVLANFRMGGASNQKSFKAAKKRIRDRYQYCYRINGYSRWYLLECVAIEVAKMVLG